LPYNEGSETHIITRYQEASVRRTFSFIIGVTLGGLTGAVLALLFAPESGEELRIKIQDRAQNFAADIRQAASTKRIELQSRLESLRAPKG
jgi:gas vesicle protein